MVVRPVSGKILHQAPGANEFAELRSLAEIPLGSTSTPRTADPADASSPGRASRSRKRASTAASSSSRQPGTTLDLKLVEELAPCAKKAKAPPRAKKPKTRKLWGDGKGKFRTTGQYSAATVRGTTWLVQDSCEGTLTRVKVGVVGVRDNVRKKTLLVRAGKRYVAKPRR